MRKQTTNNFAAMNVGQNQFKEGKKNMPVKKNPRYIYTEEDLGEGILDAGVNSSYTKDQRLWTSMLKPYR